MFTKLVHMDSLSVEATVRKVPSGELILICTCDGLKEPAPQNRVYIFRSKDNGKTWSKKQMLNEEDGFAHYQTETAIIENEIRIFISKHNGGFIDWQNYYLSSFDSGLTWKKHETPCVSQNSFIRGMLKMSNGQIIFPYHYYPLTKEQNDYSKLKNLNAFDNDIEYVENGIIISNDGGKNFEKQIVFVDYTKDLLAQGYISWVWSENTIIELNKGHLVMLYRIDTSGFLWRTDSFDYGKTWTNRYKTDIPNPANKPQLLKTNNGIVVLINTPNSKRGLNSRYPLQIWLSDDNMKSWYKKITVSEFPGAYSYANGFIDERGHLLMAFEFNRHDIYFVDCDLQND